MLCVHLQKFNQVLLLEQLQFAVRHDRIDSHWVIVRWSPSLQFPALQKDPMVDGIIGLAVVAGHPGVPKGCVSGECCDAENMLKPRGCKSGSH